MYDQATHHPGTLSEQGTSTTSGEHFPIYHQIFLILKNYHISVLGMAYPKQYLVLELTNVWPLIISL